MMKRIYILSFFAFLFLSLSAHENKIVEFQGQLSAHGQYAPRDGHYGLVGARYIPQLNINIPTNSEHVFDFEISADLSTYYTHSTNYTGNTTWEKLNGQQAWGANYANEHHRAAGKIAPYRFWARYRYKQLELRAGLQKIDFGSATMLRPLQWFNSMDPRDPLKITNGVFGVLGRYYFENNANVWLWGLTMNTMQRGIDVFTSHEYLPEFGGRFQYPVPLGELAFTYNHKWIDTQKIVPNSAHKTIQEDKFALDGKWDVGVGLWFETCYGFLHEPLSSLTHQFAFNLGVDYTFGIGNGLNLIAEHLLMSYDSRAFGFENVQNITAIQLAYPVAMFDNLSLMAYYNWEQRAPSAFLSYMHAFEKLNLFANLYYNPKVTQQTKLAQNDMQMGQGVGVQVMLVFNH